MSYKITCYCNDETIETTTAYVSYIGSTYSYDYGDSRLGDYDEFSVSGLGESWSTRFTATPASGCSFYRWVYRIGSTSATLQYSYDNPFTYTGGEDIYIRAVGEEDYVDESPWTAWEMSHLEISTYEQSVDIWNDEVGSDLLEPYNVHSFSVVFDYSGYAHFYTNSSIDTLGYLSNRYGWNSEWSGPAYEIASDDDSGDGSNFDIKYYVTAGTEYRVYVRGYSGEESGYVTLCVTEPWDIITSNYGTLSAAKSESVYLNPCKLYRRQVSFSKSGKVTISTSGSIDTRGWLSTKDTWDRGEPTNYVIYDDDSGSGTNFSFTYDVEAGQTYYIWFRAYDASSSGNITLTVSEVSEEISITKWSWTASNGNASASLTQAAYSAVVDKTAVTNFSYLVWNDLCDKVKEILDATGGSWDSTYATYANTKMSSSNKTLTATKFNSLRYNIGSHYSTGISTVYADDDVLGSYFTKLASCINGWIDTL